MSQLACKLNKKSVIHSSKRTSFSDSRLNIYHTQGKFTSGTHLVLSRKRYHNLAAITSIIFASNVHAQPKRGNRKTGLNPHATYTTQFPLRTIIERSNPNANLLPIKHTPASNISRNGFELSRSPNITFYRPLNYMVSPFSRTQTILRENNVKIITPSETHNGELRA